MRTLLLTFVLISFGSFAQNDINFLVLDSALNEPIYGAKIHLVGTSLGAITKDNGSAVLTNVPRGTHTVKVSVFGYLEKEVAIEAPSKNDIVVRLVSEAHDVEEVIVEATRSNRSIANLPTRTEVLTDEIDEAASMEPSKIAHLITHSTGIQVQTTSASSNGAVVRIQGLNGRYTQMLKDGFPLYGGFSGSLDILQIPPLDLRQVEYIKGSASTLYGGGAIGGLINLLSKKGNADETLLHMNVSHIGARDLNAFASRRFGKFGFTNLASFHLHRAFDANGDNYSDIPEIGKFNFNPKLFYNPDDRSEIYLGASITSENRFSGDMNLIDNLHPDSSNFYYDKQKSSRFTTQFSADRELNKHSTITLKNSTSAFNRFIQIRQNIAGDMSEFSGKQFNTFSELNYNLDKEQHNLTIGLNVYSDAFTEQQLDTVPLRDQQYLTYGAFANYLWDVSKKFSLEAGFRGDYVQAKSITTENGGDFFALPRMNLLYKMNKSLSFRAGGGMGYRMPTIFNEEAEPFGYQGVQAIDFENVAPEESYGVNFDFKYQSRLGTENILLTFNQMFFYNNISNPILLNGDSLGNLTYSNAADILYTQGFESQIKLTFWQFTWFVGYTYTDAFLRSGDSDSRLILTPQHSIKGDLLFVVEDKWRIGWDYEYKSSQLLTSGISTRSLFTTGVIVERTLDNFIIFLNAENFTDTRQTRYESVLSGVNNTPQFTEVWGPLDGFFFNAGLKIKL